MLGFRLIRFRNAAPTKNRNFIHFFLRYFQNVSLIRYVYDSHYDMYDSTSGSFPIRFLSEDESEHKDWYAKKRESLEQARETERLAQEEYRERAELERLKNKYEKEENACTD